MAKSITRMSPEFALVQALETVPVLRGGVYALQPAKTARPPFAFYITTEDEEEQDLDGPSGLQTWSGALHLVAAGARALQLLVCKAKQALYDMQGGVYATPAADAEEGPKGRILVESVEVELNSPELYEAEVGLYRRVYAVRLGFQTEAIFDDEEVSG